MTDTLKAIRVDGKVWEDFKNISDKEGRNHGKMLEILIEKYKEVNNVSANKTNA